MKIERILAGIKSSQEPAAKPAEKVASETPAAPREALGAALTAATQTEKVAAAAPVAAQPVVADVMKVAAELAEADKQAAVAEAKLLGDAFGDALLARLDGWSKTAEVLLEKINAAAPAGETKTASEDELRKAAEYGYNQAVEQIEKLAEDEYNKGWNETVEAIYKTAGEEFLKAAAITDQLIAANA